MATIPIYGLMAEFRSPEMLLHAAERASQEGFKRMDAYTPFPVEGLAEAIGFSRTRVPLIVLIGGIKRIGNVTKTLVPFKCGVYVLIGLYVILQNAEALPEVFRMIFHGAFNGTEGRLEVRDYERQPWPVALESDMQLIKNFGERQTIDIETREGRRLSSRVETPRGHWDNPLSDAELRAKFLDLAEPVLGTRAAEVADLIDGLDESRSLPRVLALLRAPR